jgi:putative membrane-bound dehydrogenase-like protein
MALRPVRLFSLAALFAVAAGPAGRGVAAEPAAPFQVADGLAIEPFAVEPLLANPADIDVDARGRVWVCEVLNYRGKKETRPEGDRILVLEDTDGDGRADRQTVFHQGRDVDSALGICVIGEGPGRRVIVSCAPEVLVFHDDDGDLRADRRETLFTKTGRPQHDHSVHAFVVGPDGRWYFNFGNTGHTMHDAGGNPVKDRFGNVVNDSGKPYRQGMVFRCLPDGSDFEVLGHNFRNNYEVAVDAFGTLWQSDNDDDGNRSVRINFVMEHGNYGYVDERTGAGWRSPRTNLEAEVPLQHWHQNDPGVVPNLLLTGGGSPAGICVYEGGLLPERFRGSLVHCDAGPNVVRAYHVAPAGAGYAAASETVVEGSADRWFRPSDVCVAPDGSLIVADWYDPGVGGHGMGDVDKGRIYRIAPPGAVWRVPAIDLGTVAGAVAALGSPNHHARATALERLGREPEAAHAALEAAFAAAAEPRLRARLAWAAGMLPGRAEAWIARLTRDADAELRVVAVRMCRRTRGDLPGVAARLAADPAPAVRREVALALKGLKGTWADEAWAEAALHHVAGDRWSVEALGIGADGAAGLAGPSDWDTRLAAWRARVGDAWRSPAGRAIVWRSRAVATPALICGLIADPAVTTSESLALARALDFQEAAAVQAALKSLVPVFDAADEKRRVILPELVARLDDGAAADATLAARIDEAAGFVAGMPAFVEIARRFHLTGRAGELVALAAAPGTDEQLAAAAARAAFGLGAADAICATATTAPADEVARLLTGVGLCGTEPAVDLLAGLVGDDRAAPGTRGTAVLALGRSQRGAERLVTLAEAGALPGALAQAAAATLALAPWGNVRQAAAKVLPLPQPKGGGKLPTLNELTRHGSGDAGRGRAVFAGAGTCAKCHVVGGAGKAVGPDLSGIGAKLSRVALYESILAPSAAISHNYETWTAVRTDGRVATGLLVSRTDAEVVVRGPDGIDVTVPKAELDELVRQPLSLMPAELATTLSAAELVDLVAYLETLTAR